MHQLLSSGNHWRLVLGRLGAQPFALVLPKLCQEKTVGWWPWYCHPMITTRSSLVVRHFAPTDVKSGKSTSLSRTELLSKGRNLVSTVESPDGWRSVSLPSDPTLNLGQKLTLKEASPSYSSLLRDLKQRRSVEHNKKRPVVLAAGDTFAVSELQEFEGTDFSYLLGRVEPSQRFPSSIVGNGSLPEKKRQKRAHDDLDDTDNVEEQRKDKRRRPSDTSKMSLYDLIPYPHHHAFSPVSINQRPNLDITKRFSPFSKSPFVPIRPYTSRKAELVFKDPYTRSAWVIPVSGKLPWKDASSANLVDDSPISTPGLGQGTQSPLSITWSPVVVNKFWSDLLEIRKQGLLGSISLSFRVASVENPKVNATKATAFSRPLTRQATRQHLTQPDSNSAEQCTYIKIYQDARYSMYVRSVLDAWRTEVAVDETRAAPRDTRSPRRLRSTAGPNRIPVPKKIKVRTLQGARLVLLDEMGQAVGIC